MDTWTQNIGEGQPFTDLAIVRDDGVYRMSVLADGGDVQITGNTAFRQQPSQPILLHDKEGTVFTAYPNAPMELSITPVGGALAKVLIFNN
jgi:hypothetical protein